MKVLMLFLDAFRHDLLTEENTPFLYKLAKEGVSSNLNTLAGYHVEYSMFSGCLPTKHHAWIWWGYAPDKSSYKWIKLFMPIFKLLDRKPTRKPLRLGISLITMFLRNLQGKSRYMMVNNIPLELLPKFHTSIDKSYIDQNSLPVPTIFDVLRREGKKYVAYDYPVQATQEKTKLYTSHGDDIVQLEILKKTLEKDYDLRYAHIWNLDSLQHEFGTHSKEVKEHLQKMDAKIKELVEEARKKEPTTVIAFADHGMSPVTKTMDPTEALKKYDKEKLDYFLGSTLVNIWLKDKTIKEDLKNDFKKLGCEVYDETNIETIKLPKDRWTVGDVMIAAPPESQFYPDFFRDGAKVEAMHGYTTKVPEQDGIFIVNGPGIKPKTLKNVQLIDITPTTLEVMGIKTPEICDGIPKI